MSKTLIIVVQLGLIRAYHEIQNVADRQIVYHVTISCLVADAVAANQLCLDGNELAGETVQLMDNQHEHFVEFKISSPTSTSENRSALLTAV